jgi:multidrug efflux system membrane fusion protein
VVGSDWCGLKGLLINGIFMMVFCVEGRGVRAVADKVMAIAVRVLWMCCIFAGVPALGAAGQYSVKAQPVADMKSLFAVVEAVDITPARARISGTIVELLIDEGQIVTAGQVLARVRDPKQSMQIDASQAKLHSLDAQLELATTTLQRVATLYQSGKISKAAYDEARTQVDVITADIAAAKSDQAVIRQAQTEGQVLAPANGRVLKVNVTNGGVILPGEVIATIAAESYVLRLMLPERHARFIKLGDKVLVGDRGMLDPDFALKQGEIREGQIVQVYPELTNGRVAADVEVTGLGDFFIGERIRVWVATDARDALVIPPEYIYHRYGLSFVHLASGSEVVVQPGMAVATGVEILSGLREGDILLAPGSPVNTSGAER